MENKWRKNSRKYDKQEGDRGKSDSREGGCDNGTGEERHVTGGNMKGTKDVRVDGSKGNSITGMVTGRTEAGKKGTTEKATGEKSTTR